MVNVNSVNVQQKTDVVKSDKVNKDVKGGQNSAVAPQQAAAEATDGVQLSAEAKQMEQITQTLDSLPEMNAAKVEEIRQALADGTYEVNAKGIAAGMKAMGVL